MLMSYLLRLKLFNGVNSGSSLTVVHVVYHMILFIHRVTFINVGSVVQHVFAVSSFNSLIQFLLQN